VFYNSSFLTFNTLLEQLIDQAELQDERQSFLDILEGGRAVIECNDDIRKWIHRMLEMQPKFEDNDSAFQAVKAGLAKIDIHMRAVMKRQEQLHFMFEED